MAKTCPLCGTTFPDSSIFCLHDGTSLRTVEESDDIINQTFCDRYVVTECLGQGGMGAVYLARDVRLPQKVAIKVLRQRTATDPALVARFRQEAQAASRINHDRVARVFDFGFMEDGRAYIVMEYADGRTLREVMDDGPIEPRVAANIVLMIAEGLNAAHRLGILHRDLKPENVMILDDGNRDSAKRATPSGVDNTGGIRVKVLDFGIAKVLDTEEGEVRTEAGFVIGTPMWMSPEQLLAEPLDARSDIFALGLLAFSMLTGARAFTGGTKQAEMMAPLSSMPRSLKEMAPNVAWPAGLQELLDRTLARSASERPDSALEFANEMAHIINANAPTPAPRVIPTPKPQPNPAKPLLFGGGLIAAFLIGVIAYKKINRNDTVVPPVVPSVESAAVARPAGTDTATTPVVATNPPATNTTPLQNSNGATNGGTTTVRVPPPPVRDNPPPANSNSSTDAGTVAADVLKLRELMKEADESLTANVSEATKLTRARQLLRDLDALKLTSAADKGWAFLYKGMAHATLDEKTSACAEFNRAASSGSPSQGLKKSVEEWQITMGCPP